MVLIMIFIIIIWANLVKTCFIHKNIGKKLMSHRYFSGIRSKKQRYRQQKQGVNRLKQTVHQSKILQMLQHILH